MKLFQTPVQGVKIIEPPCFEDDRGFFSPIFEDRKFSELGISDRFTRLNNSFSIKKGTIRGLHYQLAPAQEAKMICVIRGRIWDVALDLREDSPTYRKWTGTELNAETRCWLYLPAGCAHGFQTLEDSTEVIYLCSSYYDQQREKGIRWDDPSFSISWPIPPAILSDKDRNWPDFDSSGLD